MPEVRRWPVRFGIESYSDSIGKQGSTNKEQEKRSRGLPDQDGNAVACKEGHCLAGDW
jgi:hypothetical protein